MRVDIRCGAWYAEVAPALGANVTRLQCAGEDVLVPLKDPKQLAINPYLQGAPILLPANRTKDGKFTFDGKEYLLPVNEPYTGAHLHGLVHLQAFTVVKKSEDSVTLRYENKGEVFPFPFVLDVCYTVLSSGFHQMYTIKNSGDSNLPVTFALHTTFVEPKRFTVPIDACQEKEEHHIPTGRYVPLAAQEAHYVSGSASEGLTISGYYRACGHIAEVGDYRYSVSREFDHWILFNGRGESGLLCVEPQCGAVDGLNDQNGHRVVAPGKTLTLWTQIERQSI